jgi:hypothetical protein
VLPMIISGTFTFSFLPILNGFLLFFSFNLFMNRYTAMLTANAIEYENLFGQKGSIPLTVITKLEQKRNILAFFREFRLLEFAKKTGICFMDENMDEFEINIYTNSFENKRVFDSIINNANQCNNYKIRMYTT